MAINDRKIDILKDIRLKEEEAKRLSKGLCPFCGMKAKTFRNEISKKEFEISGLCQECQDKMFGKD